MEDMMMMMKTKKHCISNSSTQSPSSCSSPLALHKDSQTISKVKPKIRIIHIFAPEIIKTDVENFRELVQRLTGKPSSADHIKGCNNKNKKSRIPRRHGDLHQSNSTNLCNKQAELRNELVNSSGMVQIQVKEEEEEEKMWSTGASLGGFLSGFSDLDGFIQELDDFSMLQPLEANHMHGFGESQLA